MVRIEESDASASCRQPDHLSIPTAIVMKVANSALP